MLKVPVNVPTLGGVNTMPQVQVEFAATLVPQVLVKMLQAWLPVKTALDIVIGVEPAFWKVTVIGALVDPTFVVGNAKDGGVTLTAVP